MSIERIILRCAEQLDHRAAHLRRCLKGPSSQLKPSTAPCIERIMLRCAELLGHRAAHPLRCRRGPLSQLKPSTARCRADLKHRSSTSDVDSSFRSSRTALCRLTAAIVLPNLYLGIGRLFVFLIISYSTLPPDRKDPLAQSPPRQSCGRFLPWPYLAQASPD